MIDPRKLEVVRSGPVGKPQKDNHCGAATASDREGSLHLLIGAHHGSFAHYCMPPKQHHWEKVEDGLAIGRSATYPSLVCDQKGTLHLTYRYEPGGRDARLYYCRRPKGERWSVPPWG